MTKRLHCWTVEAEAEVEVEVEVVRMAVRENLDGKASRISKACPGGGHQP